MNSTETKGRKENPEIFAPEKIRLIHGDFFQLYEREEKFDLILTDPPYGVVSEIHSWDRSPELVQLENIFNQLLKPTGQVLVFCDLNLLVNLMGSFNRHLKFRCFHVWKKPGGMPVSLHRPINNAEFILVFRKAGAKEKDLTWRPYDMTEKVKPYLKRNYSPDIPTRRMKKSAFNENTTGKAYPKSVIEAPGKPNMEACERSNHPTQKPESLLRKLIRGYSNPGELILDPFAGSGSTLISAHKEHRRAVGFEIEEKYFLEAKKRIESIINQITLF